jgi:phenylacetic acid degradation protein paaN
MVLVKPHPETILPVAFMVDLAQQVLVEAGQQSGCIHLIVDDETHQKTIQVMDDPRVRILDFTGGRDFGLQLEQTQPRYQVFTETAGCNSVLLRSTFDLEQTLDALAFSLCLFSAQMCTAPQNIWVAQDGVIEIKDGVRRIYSVDEVSQYLSQAIDAYIHSPHKASALCATLQSSRVYAEIQRVTQACQDPLNQGLIIKASYPYLHPEFPNARTATPLLVQLKNTHRKLAQNECFGPISFLIVAPSFQEALQGATSDAQEYGAIASYAYCIDEDEINQIESEYWNHGASIGFNLHRQRPLNYTAAFSDFHVTGLNPAGNASLTDLSFILNRTRQVQSKREIIERS